MVSDPVSTATETQLQSAVKTSVSRQMVLQAGSSVHEELIKHNPASEDITSPLINLIFEMFLELRNFTSVLLNLISIDSLRFIL